MHFYYILFPLDYVFCFLKQDRQNFGTAAKKIVAKAVVHQCKCGQTLKPDLETVWKVYVENDKQRHRANTNTFIQYFSDCLVFEISHYVLLKHSTSLKYAPLHLSPLIYKA